MMKYVVCGTSVEDVEAGVQAMKMAIASGATCGVGGNTMAEVEKNLDAMKQMVGGVAPSQMGRDCLRSPNGYCPYCEGEEDTGSYSRSVSGREVRRMIEEAKPKIGYRWAIATPDGWHEPHEKTFATIDEVKGDIEAFGYPMEYVSIDKVSDDDGAISVIQCIKAACSVCTEDEYGDEEEEADCSEGYMAMAEDGREISYLCDTPEEAMETALAEGYCLDQIYVNEVRVYDDDAVEVISTVYPPTN